MAISSYHEVIDIRRSIRRNSYRSSFAVGVNTARRHYNGVHGQVCLKISGIHVERKHEAKKLHHSRMLNSGVPADKIVIGLNSGARTFKVGFCVKWFVSSSKNIP